MNLGEDHDGDRTMLDRLGRERVYVVNDCLVSKRLCYEHGYVEVCQGCQGDGTRVTAIDPVGGEGEAR